MPVQMNTCLCGNAIEDMGGKCPRCAALDVLGLDPNAKKENVEAAFRAAVRAFHPEQYKDNPDLAKVAEGRLTAANSAYHYLVSTFIESSQRKLHEQERSPEDELYKFAPLIAAKRRSPVKLILFLVILASVAGAALFHWRTQETEQSVNMLHELGFDPKPENTAPASPTDSTADESATKQAANHPQPNKIQPAGRKVLPYITVGSTKDEVLKLLGTPTASTADTFEYKGSKLYFKDDIVSGWKIDPISAPLRVKLWPDGPVDTSLPYFTVGSSKDMVLVIQGTPTEFTEDKFSYGRSEVYFQNDRVVRWKEDPESIPLKAILR